MARLLGMTILRDDVLESAKLLGVNAGAGLDELRQAFKKKALEAHPDKGGSPEDFRSVKRAFDVLCEHTIITGPMEAPSELEEAKAARRRLSQPQPEPEEEVPLKRGDVVMVSEDFISDSEGGAYLEAGQRGMIVEVDFEGDAYIAFDDHVKKQWVYRQNYDKLRLVPFEAGDAVVVRRDFMADSGEGVWLRRGTDGTVLEIDEEGDARIGFQGLEEDQIISKLSFVYLAKVKLAAAIEGAKAQLWRYNPPSPKEITIRSTPELFGPRAGGELSPGDTFRVSQEHRGDDGILYLRLADGRGWLFEERPDVGVLCERVEENGRGMAS